MASTINSTTTGSGGLITTGDASNELQIQTADTTRMTINSSGNVGVGTTSPLSVANQTSVTINGTNYGRVDLYSGGSQRAYWYGYSSGSALGAAGATYLAFDTNSSERMRIDSSGNVGIGTSSIDSWAKLKIQGTAGAQTGAAQQLIISAPTTTAGQGAGIRLNASSGSNEAIGVIGVVNEASGLAGAMTFHVYDLGATIPERMRLTSAGNLLFGTTSASDARINTYHDNTALYSLDCNSSSNTGTQYYLNFKRQGTAAGYLTSNNSTSVQLNNTSDVRLKENIQDAGSALPSVMAAQVRQFDWKENRSPHQDFGFIAQELVDVIPEAVTVGTDNEDGTVKMPWGVDYSHIVPRLVKAIQELKAENDALKARLDAAGL